VSKNNSLDLTGFLGKQSRSSLEKFSKRELVDLALHAKEYIAELEERYTELHYEFELMKKHADTLSKAFLQMENQMKERRENLREDEIKKWIKFGLEAGFDLTAMRDEV
jgi:hypothetical protein